MSYVRIWIHAVFGVKNREPLITKDAKNQIIEHIKKNARKKNIFLDKINGDKDHIHCLISLGAEQSIAKIAQLIKGESSFWINQNKITKTKFEWGE